MEIIHVSYEEIDKAKWDHCILHAKNGSLYSTSMYLDELAGKWDALICGDYQIIMPLVFKKKAGIKYLYQPAFLPAVGIFSSGKLTDKIINAFMDKAFSLFRFADMTLAWPVTITIAGKNIKLQQRNNFVINLDRSYKAIHASYDPSFTKSLRRLQKLELQYAESDNIKEVFSLFKKLYGEKISLKKTELDQFCKACAILQRTGNLYIRKVMSKEHQLLGIVLLPEYRGRLYNMISCLTPEGKKAEANYFLYDRVIKEFAGKMAVLDLEGSDIRGIAYFYKKMGPVNEVYSALRYNNLPALLQLIKK